MPTPSKSYEDYPKGKIAVEGGELQDCYDVNLSFEDGETDVHTFRNAGQPSGSTAGKRKATVTFKSAISRAGFERDFLGRWNRRRVTQVRVKIPGKTVTITGRYRNPQFTTNADNFVDFQITHAGKYSLS
jgi:hypothetical protein